MGLGKGESKEEKEGKGNKIKFEVNCGDCGCLDGEKAMEME